MKNDARIVGILNNILDMHESTTTALQALQKEQLEFNKRIYDMLLSLTTLVLDLQEKMDDR